MISIMFLILLSSQLDCRPNYCEDIAPNGSYKGFGIYRYYEGTDQNETIRLYREDIEIVVELKSDLSLKFIESYPLNDQNLKFSFYYSREDVNWKGYINCKVPARQYVKFQVIYCSNDINLSRHTSNFIYGEPLNMVVIVKQFINSQINPEHILIIDRNRRSTDYIYTSEYVHDCFYGSCYDKQLCKLPNFIQAMNDSYFSNVDAILDVKIDNNIRYWIVFNIEGRPKYCITSEESLSKECKTPEKMKTLFNECFDPLWKEMNEDSTYPSDYSKSNSAQLTPFVCFLLVLAVIIVISVVLFI